MSVNSSHHLLLHYCLDSRDGLLIYNSFGITKILLLVPLSILIFYLGHQRSATATSHSDVFTYHMAAMELNSFVYFIVYICGTYTDLKTMTKAAFNVYNTVFPGEVCFHLITCVERYLAVVHPVIYLGLRQSRGVRIRTISVVCVWLLCFGWCGITYWYDPEFPTIPFFCMLATSLIAMSYCSLCVLCVLIRPGPGKEGGDEERVDQSKRRAFHTVMAITGVLWLWIVGIIVCAALESSHLLLHTDGCVVMSSGVWCSLPGSLVLPLLFLHRAGKLQC